MKLLKTLGLVLVLGVSALPQTGVSRTVTNADLEKYRQARVASDEEYRKNYEKLGLPSPEELERRQDERQKRLSEWSMRIRSQRQQEEYLEILRSLAASAASITGQNGPQVIYVDSRPYYSSYQTGYGAGYGAGFYSPFVFRGRSSYFNSDKGFGPNTQMARDQASMFPSAISIRESIQNNWQNPQGSRGRGRPIAPRP